MRAKMCKCCALMLRACTCIYLGPHDYEAKWGRPIISVAAKGEYTNNKTKASTKYKQQSRCISRCARAFDGDPSDPSHMQAPKHVRVCARIFVGGGEIWQVHRCATYHRQSETRCRAPMLQLPSSKSVVADSATSRTLSWVTRGPVFFHKDAQLYKPPT